MLWNEAYGVSGRTAFWVAETPCVCDWRPQKALSPMTGMGVWGLEWGAHAQDQAQIFSLIIQSQLLLFIWIGGLGSWEIKASSRIYNSGKQWFQWTGRWDDHLAVWGSFSHWANGPRKGLLHQYRGIRLIPEGNWVAIHSGAKRRRCGNYRGSLSCPLVLSWPGLKVNVTLAQPQREWTTEDPGPSGQGQRTHGWVAEEAG